jgi:hypothetical protein
MKGPTQHSEAEIKHPLYILGLQDMHIVVFQGMPSLATFSKPIESLGILVSAN